MRVQAVTNFENVFIYVADALRYDSVPSVLSDEYTVIKTAASGTMSPSCFSTIFTGHYPPQHGVYGFQNKVREDMPTLYDLPLNPSGWKMRGELGHVLRVQDVPEQTLDDVEPPFFHVERDTVTHAPYGEKFDWDDSQFDSHRAYWRARGGDTAQIRTDFETGAKLAAERFQDRLDTLEDRGLLDDTLVIFTADHGELLGEYGLVGHGKVTCPELVYTPTLFCNDSVNPDGEFMAHVDLFPTIASLLGVEPATTSKLPGHDLTEGAPSGRLIFNEVRKSWGGEHSAWDESGGLVFFERDVIGTARWLLGRLIGGESAVYSRRHAHRVGLVALRRLFTDHQRFGTPGFTQELAADFCEDVRTGQVEVTHHDLDEEIEERLRAMGYVEEMR